MNAAFLDDGHARLANDLLRDWKAAFQIALTQALIRIHGAVITALFLLPMRDPAMTDLVPELAHGPSLSPQRERTENPGGSGCR